MEPLLFVLLVYSGVISECAAVLEHNEPQCYSRFDYEYKVIQNLVTLKTTEQELRNMISELQSTVKDLQTKCKARVSFSVQLQNQFANEGGLSVVKFEHVIFNIGNGYDVNTGKFTAPLAGIYLVSAEVASPKSSRYYIMLNDKNVGYLFTTGAIRKWESSSESLSLRLSVGDEVWINGKGIFEGYAPHSCDNGLKCYHSSFTGILVQPD